MKLTELRFYEMPNNLKHTSLFKNIASMVSISKDRAKTIAGLEISILIYTVISL